MTVNSSPRQQSSRYDRSIRDMRTPNHHCAVGTGATFLTIQSLPLPSIGEYAAWVSPILAARNPLGRGCATWATPEHLRRAVAMRRNGCSFAEIGATTGASGGIVGRWLRRLPPELGGEPAQLAVLS
jgi:hypothetical protein